MIILEGPDASGKSTLARRLEQQHGYTVVKWDQTHTYDQMIDWLADPQRGTDHVVCDRFPLFSEEIYGPILRNRTKFTEKEQMNTLLLLQSLRPLMVLCTEVDEAAFSATPQLPTALENRVAALAYQGARKGWEQFFPVFPYSFLESDRFNLDSLVRRDVGPPDWWRAMFEGRYAGMGRLGSPAYFLLAESIGPLNRHHIPFEAGPSGIFMTEILANTQTPLSQVFITNYVKGQLSEAENQIALRTELEQTKPSRVIVLGSPARRGIPLIKYLGFPYRTLVHPSYWLRSGKWKAEYYTLFNEAKTGAGE